MHVSWLQSAGVSEKFVTPLAGMYHMFEVGLASLLLSTIIE